jgi:Mrp family chromosome partitioning ATPase
LHTTLGLHPGRGLHEYLLGDEALASYITKTSVPNLSFLYAGKPPPNPSEVLSSLKMKQLLQRFQQRNHGRCTIIDSAPAHLAETAFLASHVDGVVMVARAGKTEKESLLQAIENIGRDKIFGLVFNASNEPLKKYKHYYPYYGKARQ